MMILSMMRTMIISGDHGDEIPSDVDYNFDVAWNHHQKNNPHHWQYWGTAKR